MKEKNQSIVSQVASAVRSGASVPASILKDTAALQQAAMVSKLIKDDRQTSTPFMEDDGQIGILMSGLENISRNRMARIEDSENISKLFPDIELAIQILISSVLSPKDMIGNELIYRAENSRLPAAVTKTLIEVVSDEMNNYYGLEGEQPAILRQAAFDSGAHVKVILPESAVDLVINRGVRATEAIDDLNGNVKNVGWLGSRSARIPVGESGITKHVPYVPNVGAAFRDDHPDIELAAEVGKFVEVYDDIDLLKMQSLKDKESSEIADQLAPNRLSSKFSASRERLSVAVRESAVLKAESTDSSKPKTPSVLELRNMLYKSPTVDYKPYFVLPGKDALKRKSIGRPLYMSWPTEAMIPLYSPNDPSRHIGYFALQSIDGTPVSVDSSSYDSGQGLSSMLQSDKTNTSLSTMLTEKARRNLGDQTIVPTLDHITDVYANLVEADWLERKRRGRDTREVKIGRNNDLMQIMLARSLRGTMTRVIYIPAEYVCYYALKFNRNGTGKSFLDDLSNISSLRAMVLFSNVMARVKQAIQVTSVDINFDPRDPDPIKTIETVKHLVARTRQQYFPHGLNRVVDLTDWIQRAGVEITWQGHPKLPGTKIEFTTKNVDHPTADDSLDEQFRHQTYMHLGLSPETVDSAAKADFATTIQQGSILFSRRVNMMATALAEKNSECVRKVVSNDEVIIEKMIASLRANKGLVEKCLDDEEREFFKDDETGMFAYVIQDFLMSLEVCTPKADFTTHENLSKEMDTYAKSLDEALRHIFSPDALPDEVGGDVSQHLDNLQKAWKAELMRRWMANNNFLPEAFDIATVSEDGRPLVDLLDSVTGHGKAVSLSVLNYLSSSRSTRWATNKSLEELGEGDPAQTSGSSGGEGGGGGDEFSSGNPFDTPLVDEEPEGGGEGGGSEKVETPGDEFSNGNPFEAS